MNAPVLPTTRAEVRAVPAAARRPRLYKPVIVRLGDIPWLTPLTMFVIVAALTGFVSWLLGTPISTALNTAYGLAIVNYLVRRQQRLLTRLRPWIALDDAHFKYEWYALTHFRHVFVIGFGLLAPAALVAVNWNSAALRAIFSGHAFPPAYLWSFALAMLDWVLIMQVLVIVVSNALRFYRLGRDHTDLDRGSDPSFGIDGRDADIGRLVFPPGLEPAAAVNEAIDPASVIPSSSIWPIISWQTAQKVISWPMRCRRRR